VQCISEQSSSDVDQGYSQGSDRVSPIADAASYRTEDESTGEVANSFIRLATQGFKQVILLVA